MSVSDQFETFCGNLSITNRSVLSTRYELITQRLNADFWSWDNRTAHSLHSGSYGRDTAIRGVSDIDMIFWLPPSEFRRFDGHVGNGQSALLQEVRASIRKTYPQTDTSGDGQVVVVTFTDGVSFDVVPAFELTDDSFYFPDTNGGGCWRKCDPRTEIAAMRTRNAATNDNLRWLCRMARAWKKAMAVPISGMLIDTLAYSFIATWPYRDKSYLYFDWMSRDFFRFVADQPEHQTYWSAPGSGQRVSNPVNFRWKAVRAYNLSLEAIAHAEKERWWSSGEKWREVYGSPFSA
jgi:hypothetical protein